MNRVKFLFGHRLPMLVGSLFLLTAVAVRAQVDVPTPALPAANATGVPLTAHFLWRPVADAAGYEIELAYDPEFQQLAYGNRVGSYELDVDGLWDDMTYYWHVRAIDSLEETGGWSAARSFHTVVTGAPRPTSPVDGATDLPLEPASLGFAYPTNPPNGFELEYGFDMTFRAAMRIVVPSSARAGETTLLPADTTLYWRVRVAGSAAAGPGAWSRVMHFRTMAPAPRQLGECTPILPPNGYTLEDLMVSSVWRGPSTSGADVRYEVRFSEDRTMSDGLVTFEADSSALSVELPGAGTWYWQVRALSTADDLVDGPWSTISWFTIAESSDPLLGAPSLLLPPNRSRARGVSTLLVWDSVPGATSYEVEIGRDTTFESSDSILSATETTARVTGLVSDTVYAWRVRALSSNGRMKGPWSPHFTFATRTDVLELPGVPRLIAPVNEERVTGPDVHLQWSLASGASAHVVQISSDSTFRRDVRALASFDSSATTTLEPGRRWWWRARGANDAGSGAWSAISTFTTADVSTRTPSAVAGSTQSLQLIPTPASSLVHLSARATSGSEYHLMVANMRGEMMIEQSGRADADGAIRIDLPVDRLAAGVYRLRILAADGRVEEAPLVVSR